MLPRRDGLDPTFADEKKELPKTTRKDKQAMERMKKTGISERDLEKESKEGYRDGRNEPFYLSSCYAAVAIVLHRLHGSNVSEIESFLDRVAEICDEEIGVADFVERTRQEAGVDITGLAVFIASAMP